MNVSESSVKRWCDKGVIETRHTAGGHRRISMDSVLQFLRNGDCTLVRPEALGLPPTSGKSIRVLQRGRAQLTEALLAGEEARSRQVVIDLYLAGHSLAVICDELFAAAFHEIGDRWACGEAEVYQERLGCEISSRVLIELQKLLPSPPALAPAAIGGTVSHDHYQLGTLMAELVLRDARWNALSLGTNLPFETVAASIRTNRPRLFWLSCSHMCDETEFLEGYSRLYEEFGTDTAIVVGGRALTDRVRQRMKYASYCDNMQHLESFARTLQGAIPPDSPPAPSAKEEL